MTEQDLAKLERWANNPTSVFIIPDGAAPVIARLLEERAVLLDAMRKIAASDHAADGGPECDHAYIADAAIAFARTLFDTPHKSG